MSAIRHMIQSIRHDRNYRQLSTARLNQNFISSKLSKQSSPVELLELLPHPHEWILFSGDRKTQVDKLTAIDIARNFDLLNGEAQSLLRPYMKEIEAILKT